MSNLGRCCSSPKETRVFWASTNMVNISGHTKAYMDIIAASSAEKDYPIQRLVVPHKA
jgi:hypothetical protein